MTREVTLRQAGGSLSATLPKDMAERLHLEAGDRVLAVVATWNAESSRFFNTEWPLDYCRRQAIL